VAILRISRLNAKLFYAVLKQGIYVVFFCIWEQKAVISLYIVT